MHLKFDSHLPHQTEAIGAIVEIFRGQPEGSGAWQEESSSTGPQLAIGGSFVIGNRLALADETIIENLHRIQEAYGLPKSETDHGTRLRHDLNFSVEMETGTGKTYVYLRTIHELHQTYGFKKFVIVVPSIAIKEGVIKNLAITEEHFRGLYGNPETNFAVYDPKKRGMLKAFATENTLQILVINIDSFAKSGKDEPSGDEGITEKPKGRGKKKGANIIYQDADGIGIPIEHIRACHPIVIVDEPQNMETDIRRQAIGNLHPLCTLRYSATHKNPYNLVYRLDPVRAYDLGLVKKIEVDSVVAEKDFNGSFIHVKAVKSLKNKAWAELTIEVATATSVARKDVKVRVGDNLFSVSGGREVYHDGFTVNGLDITNQTITFLNGETLSVGENTGRDRDDILRYMIRRTVHNHFEKEKYLAGRGIKVLTLFFIDKVANYRSYEGGVPKKGKFAEWFEEAFSEISQKPQFKGLVPASPQQVHDGYFSADKKGILKDTQGDSRDDDDTYTLIMRDKERLLSLGTPLRFIFSHSALREGWDNPNVFQICTLNETQSDTKKRQEIGRGLRLPVNQDGERIFDESVNILTVTANESYEAFAKALQSEIEEECGVKFENRIKDKSHRLPITLRKGYLLEANFCALWERISHKTTYSVAYSTEKLVRRASDRLKAQSISAPRIASRRTRIVRMGERGMEGELKGDTYDALGEHTDVVPDILGNIEEKTRLTKSTIFQILLSSGRMRDISVNPQEFVEVATREIDAVMREMMVDGIKYEKIAGESYAMQSFENHELQGYIDKLFTVSQPEKTVYDHIIVDSETVERPFVRELESRDDIRFYLKLPSWFTIPTPLGKYNPDWAIVFEGEERIYFVAETKGVSNIDDLAPSERFKILCGRKHFEEFADVVFRGPIQETRELVG